MITKTINVNELQAKISTILKEVQRNTVYEVNRYSDPIAVVMSFEDYQKMHGECKKCVEDLKKIAFKVRE